MSEEPLQRVLDPEGPFDLTRTFSNGHGPRDPSSYLERDTGAMWRATRTEDGPVSVRVREARGLLEVSAWGPGAERALEKAPSWLGFDDDPEALVPKDPIVARAKKANPGLRLGRGRPIFEVLVPTIIGQRVTGAEAGDSWRELVFDLGERAPGPRKLRIPPSAERLRDLRLPEYHRYGLESSRSRVIAKACQHIGYVRRATTLPPAEAVRHLRKLPGIGPWTSNLTVAMCMGWPDALPLGDYHFPSVVAHALVGEERADDRRMVELLEPYKGQRWRVLRLLGVDTKSAPRRHHRRAPWKVQVELATRRRERQGRG